MATANLLLERPTFLLRGPSPMVKMFMRTDSAHASIPFQKVRAVLRQGTKLLCLAIFFASGRVDAVDYTIHVHATNAALASDILAQATTGFFIGSGVKSTVSPNTWTVNVYARNPLYTAPLANKDLLAMVMAVSSMSYVNGWANGMDYERKHELVSFIAAPGIGMPDGGFYQNCTKPNYWNGLQYSNTSNQLTTIDSTTCSAVLAGVYNFIYQQSFSTPTVTPGF